MQKSSPQAVSGPVRLFDASTPPHIVTLVLMAGLSALTMNVFLPSMPGMALYFDADYAVIQLALSAYLALTGALQIVIGPLSDRYGRRRVLLVSVGIFLLATVGCILSQTAEVFLTFRMIQAVVASGTVLSRAIVRDMVPADEAASMIGYVTMGMALVPMFGPMLGGVLEDLFDWRASFGAMLVFGFMVFVLMWRDLGETNKTQSTSFKAQFATYPELFRSRRFWGYALVSAFASGAFFAFLGGAPFVATVVLGMTPTETGLYFGIIPGGYLVGNFVTGRYARRYGIRSMLLTGCSLSICGCLLVFAFFTAGFITPMALFGSIFFVGLGNGLTLPTATSGLLSVRPELAGTASGLGGAIMIGGGAALSATTGALLGPDTGAWPLVFMMLGTSVCSIIAALYTVAVERQVDGEAA